MGNVDLHRRMIFGGNKFSSSRAEILKYIIAYHFLGIYKSTICPWSFCIFLIRTLTHFTLSHKHLLNPRRNNFTNTLYKSSSSSSLFILNKCMRSLSPSLDELCLPPSSRTASAICCFFSCNASIRSSTVP